jgi:ribosomal protein S12 methylthiotransferase
MGCAKNLVDSEQLLKQLECSGFTVVFDPGSSIRLDALIINTCGFIESAKRESVDTILHYVSLKKYGKIRKLYLMGCLTERYRSELQKEIPEADGIFGVNELQKVITALGGTYRQNLLGERHLTTPGHYAYLKIAEGCSRRCSFCTIPGIRGPHLSKPMDAVIREAEILAASGVRELLVISQDTTYYGIDRYGRRKLAELLRRLSEINGIEWIRLHYAYPESFPVEVMDLISEAPRICKYLDIPLQHISSRILRSMKRGLTGDKTRALIRTIREKIPGITLRTTFITGYPGETDEEFRDLCSFVTETRFDRMGAFPYYREEGTASSLIRDNIPVQLRMSRLSMLMGIQEEISLQLNQEKVGRKLKVIIDSREGEHWTGRTEADSPEVDQEVIVRDTGLPLNPGEFHQVMIDKAGTFELYGYVTE